MTDDDAVDELKRGLSAAKVAGVYFLVGVSDLVVSGICTSATPKAASAFAGTVMIVIALIVLLYGKGRQ